MELNNKPNLTKINTKDVEENIDKNTNNNVGENTDKNTNNTVGENKNEKDVVVNISVEQVEKTLIPVIKRQTNYTDEIAKQKLVEHNYNLKSILHEFMGIKPKEKKVLTCNQTRFDKYRNNLNIN